MDITPELREAAITAAIEESSNLVTDTEWEVVKTATDAENPAELKSNPLQD